MRVRLVACTRVRERGQHDGTLVAQRRERMDRPGVRRRARACAAQLAGKDTVDGELERLDAAVRENQRADGAAQRGRAFAPEPAQRGQRHVEQRQPHALAGSPHERNELVDLREELVAAERAHRVPLLRVRFRLGREQ